MYKSGLFIQTAIKKESWINPHSIIFEPFNEFTNVVLKNGRKNKMISWLDIF